MAETSPGTFDTHQLALRINVLMLLDYKIANVGVFRVLECISIVELAERDC